MCKCGMIKCKNVNCTQRRIYGEKHRSGADGGKDFFFPLGIAGDPSLQNWGLAPIFQYLEQKILNRILNRILNHLNIVFKNGSKHLDFVKKKEDSQTRFQNDGSKDMKLT